MECNCIDIHDNNLIIEKSVNKENAIVGDVIKYNITVINEGDILIDNVTVIDTLESYLEFVEGSVVIGDIPAVTAHVLEGVEVGCLKPGQIKMISFNAKVLSRPCSGYVSNSAIAKFYYDAHLNNHLEVMDKTSNVVTVKIDIADVQICKKANRAKASRGDIVGYEVILTNVGTIQARNILFLDTIPKEVTLVPQSLTVNGNVVNYTDSDIDIYVGSIEPGESIVINYEILVNSSNCSGLLVNKAAVKFNYNLCNWSFGEKTSTTEEMASSEVKLGISTFKQISIDENLCIPCVKPDMEEINDMKVEAEIIECHIINTPVTRSNEGQILSGYKLIVRGTLKELVEYTSNTVEQAVHSAHYSIPFSSFVILPSTYVLGSKIDVDAIVEDVYYKLIDCRCFFKNVTLLINVKIMSC